MSSVRAIATQLKVSPATVSRVLNNHPDVLGGKYNLSSIKACISGSAPLMRETKEKFEVEPNMIIDYLSICGDKSDNIP